MGLMGNARKHNLPLVLFVPFVSLVSSPISSLLTPNSYLKKPMANGQQLIANYPPPVTIGIENNTRLTRGTHPKKKVAPHNHGY